MSRKIKSYQRTALCWSAIILFWLFAKMALASCPPGAAGGLDEQVLHWFASSRSNGLDQLFASVTWAGSGFVLLPLAVAWGASLLTCRLGREAIFLCAATAGAILLVDLGKYLVARPRPALWPAATDLPAGFSFPSGHATQITAFVLAGLWLLRRSTVADRWPMVAADIAGGTLIVLVCLSRLYLQVHYPSDILAGVLTATFWVMGLASLILDSPPPARPHPVPMRTPFFSTYIIAHGTLS